MLHSNPLINPPTLIETTENIRYLIVDSPSQSTLPIYLQEFERWNVTDVVRCCEPTYPKEILEENGIQVHDWIYADGDQPPGHLVNSWLKLIRRTRTEALERRKSGSKLIPCIATHCVAGLGRAPVLVAIALIEDGMSALDSVELIRERRRGAINSKQLRYLESYKREQEAGSCRVC
ncbi:dual specificity protein phosphatase CDC14B [Umbelopsis sp. PMI_123]|nr:dual specificity protein phosphatase CDC14B [Umbelopsis sp. PMI_123]